MTDLYERRVEAVESASKTLNAYFAGFTPSQVVDLADYLLHGKQTSGEETQTLGSRLWPTHNQPVIFGFDGSRDGSVIQTFGEEIDLDALSIRILENLDLIGDASWHEEEDEESQPGDEDFGEIRVFDDGINSLPVGTRINHHNSAYWEMAEGGWCSPQGSVTHPTVLCGSKGRVVLNPEILGTFRPLEHTPQPGDEDFGEIWVMDLEAVKTLPDGVELTLDGGGPGRVTVLGGQGRWAGGHRQAFHEVDFLLGGRRVLNPEILGTFRPVEA